MATMRVAQIPRLNGPFEIVERPIREPDAGSVRIKVQACGICHSDSLTRRERTRGFDTRACPATRWSAWSMQWAPGSTRGTRASASGWGHDPAAELSKIGGARVVLATAPSGEGMSALQGGLAINGSLMIVGVAPSVQASPMLLIMGRRSIKGWYSGTAIDSEDTLAFSARHGVRSLNETFPLERASDAYERMMSGQARFRVVLTIGP